MNIFGVVLDVLCCLDWISPTVGMGLDLARGDKTFQLTQEEVGRLEMNGIQLYAGHWTNGMWVVNVRKEDVDDVRWLQEHPRGHIERGTVTFPRRVRR